MARRRAGWQVYLLRCGDGSLYTGATSDLARRVACHASGRGARYTRSRLPVTLVHAEWATDRGAALRREAAIKRLPRRQKLALLKAKLLGIRAHSGNTPRVEPRKGLARSD